MAGSRLLPSNVGPGATIGPIFVGTADEKRRRPGNAGECGVV